MATDNLSEIHQLLVDKLSQEEVKTLCFNLGVDYEELPPGGKSSKVRELLLYLQRRSKLSKLKPAVKKMRSDIDWPADSIANAAKSSSGQSVTGVQLNGEEFDRLVNILAETPEFRTETTRLDFFDDVFAGSPRKTDILSLINLSGTPRGVAVRVINRLIQFGQVEPGQEALDVMINKLLSYMGGGENAEFLRGLVDR